MIMGISLLIFDWGDTIMIDYDLPGPMSGWDRVGWIPGAEEALRVLSRKHKCVIATSAPHSGKKEMIAALERVGAHRYFEGFFSANELGVRKPDPAFFTTIIEKMAAFPVEAVSIGNIYEKDIAGAKEAGLYTVFLNSSGEKGTFPRADKIINSMSQLVEAIGTLK
jgi:putative hydrolase of the HAD superfamily